MLYDSRLRIAAQSLHRCVAAHSKLRERVPVLVDNRCARRGFCTYVTRTRGPAYVSNLAANDRAVSKMGKERLDAFAARLKAEHSEAVKKRQTGQAPKPLVFQRMTICHKARASRTTWTAKRIASSLAARCAW